MANMTILPKEEKKSKVAKTVKKKKTAKKKASVNVKTTSLAVKMRKMTMNDKIRPWYMFKYPTDELGAEINPKATFMEAWNCLKEKKDIYAYLGVGDSIVRERVFGQIASLKKCGYKFVYEMWLNGTKVRPKTESDGFTKAKAQSILSKLKAYSNKDVMTEQEFKFTLVLHLRLMSIKDADKFFAFAKKYNLIRVSNGYVKLN